MQEAESPEVSPEIKAQFAQILAQTEGLPAEPSLIQQEEFLSKYSWSALVYNTIYFQAMGDRLFSWISLLAALSVVGLPLLLILPFFARRRAWKARNWPSFAHFLVLQKKWERSSGYGIAGFLLISYLLYRFLMPVLLHKLYSLDPALSQPGNSSLDQLKALEKVNQDLNN